MTDFRNRTRWWIAIDGIVLPYSTAAKQGTCSGLGATRGEQPASRFLLEHGFEEGIVKT